jgi:hypothetical protein
MAALTILAGRWGVSTDEAAHRLLRDAVFQFDESLLPTDIPPYVKLGYSILVSAIENGADEVRLVPTGEEVAVWLQVDGHTQRLMTMPPYVLVPLYERFEKMAGKCLGRVVAVPEAPIPIRHNHKTYTVTAGYVADGAASTGESLLLRIVGEAESKIAG